MSLAEYYCGCQSKRSYSQVVHMEFTPSYYLNGKPMGFFRILYVSDCYEETYLFEGVPDSLKDTTGSVTVADVGGSHTLSLSNSVVDGSTGTAVLIKETVSVRRTRMSPHMWRIEVTHYRANLLKNGAVQWAAPAEW